MLTKFSGQQARNVGGRVQILTQCQRMPFSFYHNFHQPVSLYIDGKKFTNDHNIEEYSK